MHQIPTPLAVLLVVAGVQPCWAQASRMPQDDPPVNTWVRAKANEETYVYSQPIYVPERRSILHWGRMQGAEKRNDVRVFDPATLRWSSDGPGTPPQELGDKGLAAEGRGMMLADGRPAPSIVAQGVCYDSKRKRLVYVMKGLMAAYGPAAKKWEELVVRSLLEGPHASFPDAPYGRYERGLPPETGERELVSGPPPVQAAGIGYDAVNDEIVLFSHWGGQNNDRRSIDGRVSTHTGTWRFSYAEMLWRRVGHTCGPPEIQTARAATLDLLQKLSDTLDLAWLARRHPDDPAQGARLREAVQAAGQAALKLSGTLPSDLRPAVSSLPKDLDRLAALETSRSFGDLIHAAAVLWRRLDALLDGPLRIEPPPRCNAPLVYDSRHKVLVLFGGQNNLVRTDLDPQGRDPAARGLNDTWLYDTATRRWREAACDRRPQQQQQARVVFDEATGLVLLVTYDAVRKSLALWSFDTGRGEWLLRHEQVWATPLQDWTGLALATDARLLVLENGGETLIYRLDLDQLPGKPAPPWTPPPPIEAQTIPPDDPEWVAELKKLPANRWIHPQVPRDADTRDWGIAAADAERGLVYYFGGGHSTYQVNDVAIYAVGANRWIHAAGDHNDWIPPVRWDGISMGISGGPPAGHQRNSYVAIDGRLFHTAPLHSRRWDQEIAKQAGTRLSWFYDLDRGGIWRQQPLAAVELGEGVPGTFGRAHVADPRGCVLGFAGHLEPYDGRFFQREAYFSRFDVERNRLEVRKVPEPTPDWVGECRPFCFLAGKNQVFFYEHRDTGGHRTWIYDIDENRFRDLSPKVQPPADPRTVVYLPDQDAVFAIIGQGEQWVYSFAANTWSPLPLTSDRPIGFATPYAQLVYVEKYGVLVNTGSASRGVAVMRPELPGRE